MSTKETVIKFIEEGNTSSEEFSELLNNYLSENPDDYDKFSILVNYYMQTGDMKKAYDAASEAQRINPHVAESNYNLAEVFFMKADYYNALKYYLRVKVIADNKDVNIIDSEVLANVIEECKSHLSESEIELLDIQTTYASDDPFRNVKSLAGKTFTDIKNNPSYIGIYNNWARAYCGGIEYPDNYEYEIFRIETIGNAFRYDMKGNYIAPIVGIPYKKESENWIRIDEKNKNISSTIPVLKEKTYDYLRLNGTVNIASVNPVVFGKPIPLKHHNNNKKLILNLFIDSFNYRIFELVSDSGNPLDGFKKLMPNTYELFSGGTICTNAYSDSEWTTPSLSSYWTGLYSHHHMILDEHMWWPFPEEIKLLPEYFKEHGYMTSRLGENQESAGPNQGYLRGTDRFVSTMGHNDAGRFISETIEHIEAFKECDQFIWVNFEDLHKIAGDFDSDIAIQVNTPIHFREKDSDGTTTVKQGRSKNKQVFFEKELKRLDRYFGILFSYLKSNLEDGEYIVSLFSDHGTAFMVDNDEPMICEQRTHIPIMFYDGKQKGICDEFIQNVDFAGILCRLAGIDYDYTGTDGVLPAYFGGKDKREYALSQTIYSGDPYQAMIRDKDSTFYFKTKEKFDKEFRLSSLDADCQIINDDKSSGDSEKLQKYKDIIYDIIKYSSAT